MEKTPDYIEGNTKDPRDKTAPAKPETQGKRADAKDDSPSRGE